MGGSLSSAGSAGNAPADKSVIGARLRELRERAPYWSREELARRLRAVADPEIRARMPHVESLAHMIKEWERGRHAPGRRFPNYRALYARAFDMDERDLFAPAAEVSMWQPWTDLNGAVAHDDDEIEALELARRAAASDIGGETMERLELAVDDLAVAYPSASPAVLLDRVRRYLAHVMRLFDVKKTLEEHRRLLGVGGWLSLLAGTCHIDLRQFPAAAARLRTATQLAQEAGHREIKAWCWETAAWQAVTSGEYERAVTLSQQAQDIAPRGGSAYIQAAAQEGRAHARLGAGPQTLDALRRVERLVSPLSVPGRPEHHYRYDPAKHDAYVATTLSWLGDPAAESHARQVLARLDQGTDAPPRPRRAASARLDLALALLAAGRPDEARDTTLAAVMSGLLVPSNYWRAAEVIAAVEARHVPGADELREAYRELCTPDE